MKLEDSASSANDLKHSGQSESPGRGEQSPLESDLSLATRIERVLHADCDEIDAILQDEMESAMRDCQNTEWAEMMVHHGSGFAEEDFCSDVDDDDYSF